MGGYDGIGIAVGNGIGAFDIDHCIREDGTLNDTADTVLSIFSSAYVEKSPSGKGLRGFFHVPEDYVYDKTVYYINNRSKGLEVYMPGATNHFVTVTGDVYRTGEIPNDETAMVTLLDTLMKRNKQVQQTHFQHHSYLDDEAVIAHAKEASNSEKFKKLFAGEWEDLYGSQSDADMALLSILAFWCGCDEEQIDRIFRTSGLMRPKWDRQQAGSTYGAISIRNTVNTCASVYIPVNAQDIVDEEFTNLDDDGKEKELQPDISKLTLSLEEMAPHTNPRYGRDEIDLGNMFADFFKPIARYNSERGIWFVYDGVVWQPDMENLKVAELAKLLADKLYLFALKITEEDARKRFIDRVRKLQQRKHRDTMLKDAKSVFPLSMKQYDQDIYLFNCKNGTLDLRTMEFREHRPEDFLTKVSPVTYDPEADCSRWRSFITEIMQGDKARADYPEPEKKITLDAALTKRLTGNDTITARYLHENSFEFRPNFKIFINTNHRPNITDLTLFESGRIKIIPFDRHFEENEQDKDLKSTFAKPENISGILNWMLEGYKMFRSQGLAMPDSVVQATMDYQMFSDKMGQFFDECIEEKESSELRRGAIYTRYKEWCGENGYRAEAAKNLNQEIEKRYKTARKRPNDGASSSTTPMVLGVTFMVFIL